MLSLTGKQTTRLPRLIQLNMKFRCGIVHKQSILINSKNKITVEFELLAKNRKRFFVNGKSLFVNKDTALCTSGSRSGLTEHSTPNDPADWSGNNMEWIWKVQKVRVY